MDIKILYEDEYIIACVKPVGVLSQDGGSANMPELLKEHGEIFPLHRLDKEVGGVMVFAKTHAAAGKMSALIAEGKMAKEYYAVVRGEPENKSGILEDLLFKDSSKNKSFVVKRMRKGVKKASLEYETQKTLTDGDKKYSLVKIKLHTGRTHQIRVQFSSRKMPLLGDGKYGDGRANRRYGETRQALYSYRLTFDFPTDAGILGYLRGRSFQVDQVPFRDKYFG